VNQQIFNEQLSSYPLCTLKTRGSAYSTAVLCSDLSTKFPHNSSYLLMKSHTVVSYSEVFVKVNV